MLQNTPYDLLYSIALYLDIDDLVYLGRTCRSLQALCSETTLCKRAVERCAPYAMETVKAKAAAEKPEQVDYPAVLKSIFDRKMAFSSGKPIAAASFGSFYDFTFNQGVLCLLKDSFISVHNIQKARNPKTFHISDVLGCLTFEEDTNSSSLLHYADGILTFKYAEPRTEDEYLIVVDVLLDHPLAPARRRTAVQLNDSTKLFIRNDEDFLYFGTHSALGSHGHHEWIIQGIALNPKRPFPSRARTLRTDGSCLESCKVHLSDFVGSEIGSTAAFRIHNGYFYAVTNYDDYEVVEIDWTSFYHCFKFPVGDPSKENVEINRGLYRRQHREGPFNDSWLDLSLQIDEKTNELVVVETRKEWLNGSSQAYRTFYLTELDFSENISHRGNLPDDDKLVMYANSSSKWSPDRFRQIWQIHPEQFNISSCSTNTRSRPYILAHTKFRYYNYTSNTFIDLVEDSNCCFHNYQNYGGQSCLRLRSGSRQFGPVSNPCPSLAPKEQSLDLPPLSLDFQHRRPHEEITSAQEVTHLKKTGPYRYSPVTIWPPPADTCHAGHAESAHNLLSPYIGVDAGSASRGTGLAVQAAADERTIVMLIRASALDKLGKLVVLSFDGAAAVNNELTVGVGRGERGSSSETEVSDLRGSVERSKGKQRASVSSEDTLFYGFDYDLTFDYDFTIEDCEELLNDRIFD